MRRVAFGGLVAAGIVVAVGLVLWAAILAASSSSGATRAGTSAAPPRHAPAVLVPSIAGSTCFAGTASCSQRPCTELIGAGVAVGGAVYQPAPTPGPTATCRGGGARAPAARRVTARVPSVAPALHRLQRAFPAP